MSLKIPFILAKASLLKGNKWTLVLIIVLVAVAFINLIFLASLFTGISKTADRQVQETYAGDITVMPGSGDNFVNVSKDLEVIRGLDFVDVATPRATVPGTLKFQSAITNFRVFAIDPSSEASLTNVHEKMISGEYLKSGETGQIILGREVAGGEGSNMYSVSLKGAKVGDKVEMSINGSTESFKVKGIFLTKYMFTDNIAFVSFDDYRRLVPNSNNKAGSINLSLKDGEDTNNAADKIKALGYKTSTWEDSAGYMKSIKKTFDALNTLLGIVGGLIAAVTIFIVITIDITGRRQQIGVLRAIGIESRTIANTFVIQALFYAVVGIVLGLILFIAIIMPYCRAHPFALPIGDSPLVLIQRDLTIRISLMIVLALISSFIPANIILRTKLLDLIKGR